jgi:hypothetical protein
MDYKKQLEEARALFLECLKEKGAKDIIELDESNEIIPISWQLQGILDGRWINALFTLVIGGEPKITFYHKDVNEKDLSYQDFIQVMASIEVSKPEHTLELDELQEDQQLIIKNKGGKVTFELRQNFN